VTKMLSEMTGEELAGVLSEMADRVSETVKSNQATVEQLRKAAMELESKRGTGKDNG
jgi:hypothetical protein